MTPLVSVVMPCRNAGRMLAPAVRSVLAQSYPNVELIFVDNNSSDGSLEEAHVLAAASSRPFRVVHCPEPGANHARNFGYRLAQGDYIQWLDADDALGIEKIAHQIQALEREPGAAIAYCDWMASIHQPDGQRRDHVTLLTQVDDQILRTLSGTWYPPHSYLIRRSAADRLQAERAWLPETQVGTDVEYSAIAAMLGMRFLHVPGARIQYNTWSHAQLSGGSTPYSVRIAALRTIFQRLQELARRPEVTPRITARHKILLEQDWNVWAMPAGSVEVRKRLLRPFELRHVASGRTIKAQQREATVATAMQAIGAARAFAHHALMIAARATELENDYPFIVGTLDRFRREGLLTKVRLERSAEPQT